MKQINFIFIFLLLSSATFAGDFKVECPLSTPTKLALIKDSPYYVDDVHCIKNGKTYKWFISNKKVLAMPTPSLAKKNTPRVTQKNPVNRKAKEKSINRSIASESQAKPSSSFSHDKWKIGANYGVQYFSYEQSKDLGKAKVAVTLPEYYKVYSTYRYEDFEFQFDFERYKLKYESGTNSGAEDLNEFVLKSSYKNFVLGVAMIDSPLFKSEGGLVSISSLSLTNALIGYKVAWQLPVEKETHLEFNPTFYYPVAVSSGNTDVKASKPSGYMVNFEAKLSRTLKQTDKYKVRAVWPVNAKYRSLSNKVEWGNLSGSSESRMWSVGTQLGIEINF